MVQVDGRPASQMVRAAGSRCNIERKAGRGPLIRVEIAHPFDLNQVVKRVLSDLFGGNDSSLGQGVAQTSPL